MKAKRIRFLASGLGALLLLGVPPALAAERDAPPADSHRDEEALTILRRAAEFLAQAKRFHFTVEVGWDVLQEDGQLIEFGGTRRVTVRRPDRLRAEAEGRNGRRRGFFFDGKQVVVSDLDENVYASAEKPGTLQAALDFAIEQLQTPVPLSDLLHRDLPELLTERVRSAHLVGDEILAGIYCHHVAVRNAETDTQIWIQRGKEPLLRRIVITYRHEEGHPQFRARFIAWDFAPETPDSLFAFTPHGAERIPFAVRGRSARAEGESR